MKSRLFVPSEWSSLGRMRAVNTVGCWVGYFSHTKALALLGDLLMLVGVGGYPSVGGCVIQCVCK